MKNIIKKNQIVVFVIGIMIITAGYFSYTNNSNNNILETGAIMDSEEMASIGDAKLVSANIVEENTINSNSENVINTNTISKDTNSIENVNTLPDTNEILNQTEVTGAINVDEYFTNSRLERNTMYSQRIENYQDILNNTNISEAQKKTAQEEITKLNNEQNAIMIAENLIKTKGIEDLVIFLNEDSVNVIVKGKELEKEEIAQIQNIITRELKADIGNIHIMNKE